MQGRAMGNLLGVWGLTLTLGSPALASSLSTKWTLRNDSKEPLAIQCQNQSVSELKIAMSSGTIAPGSSQVYDWGDRYYNDGLGLNPGQWSCHLEGAGGKAKTAQKPLDSFQSGWGESLTLVLQLSEGRLRLVKLPEGEPVAKGSPAQAKPAATK